MNDPIPEAIRILLVDDTPANLDILYRALEDEGFELLVALSGEEALEVTRAARPSLILLDINMPGMDGFETCRRLKADPATADSVVLFLSARGDTKDKVKGLELGAVDYIDKPFEFEEVIARVHKHLDTHQRQEHLEARNRELEERAARAFDPLDETDLRSLIASGEGETLEFKSTLRWNLHTGKPGKEIENASLKTLAGFLNSDGGVLLIGVDDEANPLGLETDKFQSRDKMLLHLNNLINAHIGLEFAEYVRASIVQFDGTDILAVQCIASPNPVFFRRDSKEIFYIRAGPSSQALSPSQLLGYLENRKG
ncbi:MAG: hypothetical protein DRP71_08760 [Verrucomicrobia bacterium]|nr:MAG: hypothetical protein DRP71_08760 [Verrucomicrobiota bacterium]